MLRNYLKIALRNLRKDALYSFVNVFGLAIGVGCCVLITLFVRHEWSYDAFHDKADRIYRAWGREDWGDGREFFYTITTIPLAEALEASIPEVEETVRIRAFEALVGPEGSRSHEDVRMVDTTFFRVFDFELVDGTASGLFKHPNTVVITPEIARKYFGDEPPLGRTLSIEILDEPQDYVVTGVVEKAPAESSIQFDLLIPFTKAPDLMNAQAFTNWFNIFVETYVLLGEGAGRAAVEAKLPAMITGVLGDEAAESGYQIGLQQITGIHLNKEYPIGIEPISDPVYSYFLAGIAALVLIVACINFVTLSIGQSARRSGEVGVRKAMGAERRQLMRQFWGEALVVVVLSVAIGTVAARLTLPIFNTLAGMELSLSLDPFFLLYLLALSLVVSILAGVYPAFVISGLRPMEVLRGRLAISGDRSLLRRGLVVLQFSISILLIISALFVVRQLDYLRSKDLGFQKEEIVVLRTGEEPEGAQMLVDRFRAELQQDPAIVSIAHSSFPMNDGWGRFGFETDDGAYAEFIANVISPEFLETMDVDLIAGRGFAVDRADPTGMVVNESFVRAFGYSSAADALFKRLPADSFGEHQIIGVVPDFNFESLHAGVRPLALVQTSDWLFRGANDINIPSSMRRDISVRIAPGDVRGTIERIEKAWTTVARDLPFDFYFLDEAIDARYRQEERLSRIIGIASALAILIACLGLFGLAALTVVRRTKEIGIRKVLGATVSNIVVLLARDFAALVGIAFILAAPVAYLIVASWLDNFAYRVEIGAATFLVAGVAALVFAIATVCYQSIRAALVDPVESLRYE